MAKSKFECEGWVAINGATKWHFLDTAGQILCGRWLYLGSAKPEPGNDYSKDNCTLCLRKMVARNNKAAKA